MSSSAVGQCLVSVSADSRVYSRRPSDEMREPMNSKAWAISWLVLDVVPSGNICAVNPASPGSCSGSREAPASISTPKATMGRPRCSITEIPMPLESLVRVGAGGLKTGSLFGGGMIVRSIVTVAGDRAGSGKTRRRTWFSPRMVSATRITSSRVTAMYLSRLVLISSGLLEKTLKWLSWSARPPNPPIRANWRKWLASIRFLTLVISSSVGGSLSSRAISASAAASTSASSWPSAAVTDRTHCPEISDEW